MVKGSDSIDPHTLQTTILQIYWVLDHLESPAQERFTLAEITHYLINDIGISMTSDAVRKALIRAKNGINKNKAGYRLMEKGRKELMATHVDETVFIESGQPFSAKRTQLAKIFKAMKGTVKICDPYLDAATLDVVFTLVDKKVPIKILTQKINDKPAGTVKRILADLAKEGFLIEVRQYGASDIHDRYVLDDSTMWLSGNSLNGLGSKESFIVKLGSDMAQSTRALFDSRWKTASLF